LIEISAKEKNSLRELEGIGIKNEPELGIQFDQLVQIVVMIYGSWGSY
jgi:hypothetical protein